MKVAGIDVHKKVLMVVVVDASTAEEKAARRRCVTMPSELHRLLTWLQEQGVEEAVMESTAQYWRSVWLELEPHMHLHLAQAFSNRAPRGRKHDFKDAERLVRRLIADELILSFVPSGEQRIWRSMTRMKLQLTRNRVRLQNQIECLLEEMRIKLSIVVSNLLGASGLRILHALANGETDPKKLAQLGGERLQCTEEQLVDALTGRAQPVHGAIILACRNRSYLRSSMGWCPCLAWAARHGYRWGLLTTNFYWQTGPASCKKVPLSENHPFTPMDGAP